MGRQMRVEWNSHQRQQSRTSIWSAATKQAILLEMTVSWENRIDDEYERKSLKYQELAEDCQQNGLWSWFSQQKLDVEGLLVSPSGARALMAMGITGTERRRLIQVYNVGGLWQHPTGVVVEKGVGQVTGRPATEGGIGDGELNGSGLGFDRGRFCLSSVTEEDFKCIT